ncbi:hypothetical protein N7478_010606 [Penicillium angulare]|uniref:uncharacterized protein n=1 Tax=Penicillium angulare TaxID=116970 RepID=UPI00254202D3|nr:uncharacterized protein N7478_010606 [Penicillium angulare]KAJ5267798.1 hypothetical protein N7478_010606 [Penicillium angulare]
MKVPRRISTDRSAAWFTILASVVAVICWSIFFAGCTSSSTSEHLYLMEVNLKGFPEIRGSSIGQGFSQLLPRALPIGVSPKEIPTEIGSATSGIASTVENTPQEVAGAAENIASEIKLHLPDYYRVGLWGYCSGDDDQKAVCSHPSLSFYFDLSAILRSASPLVDHILRDKGDHGISGYARLSHGITCMCILGLIVTVLAIVLGVWREFYGGHKKLLTAFHMCSLALVTAATIGVTTMYGILSHTINNFLGDLGGQARVGGSMLALLWMATFFSLGAFSVSFVRFFRRDF